MTIQIGQLAPDFEQDTANGSVRFHSWIGSSWCALFSQPEMLTAIGMTEIAAIVRLRPAWKRRGVRVIGLSVGTPERHLQWASEVEATHGCVVDFPLIADCDRTVAGLYGLREQNGPAAHRVFLLDPGKVVRLVMSYPASTGCNFTEILRAIDRLQVARAFEASAARSGWTGREERTTAEQMRDAIERVPGVGEAVAGVEE